MEIVFDVAIQLSYSFSCFIEVSIRGMNAVPLTFSSPALTCDDLQMTFMAPVKEWVRIIYRKIPNISRPRIEAPLLTNTDSSSEYKPSRI